MSSKPGNATLCWQLEAVWIRTYRVTGYGVMVNWLKSDRCPGNLAKPRTGHFLIGCSFTFETPLMQAGIDVRHISEDCNVPMYRTNRLP